MEGETIAAYGMLLLAAVPFIAYIVLRLQQRFRGGRGHGATE